LVLGDWIFTLTKTNAVRNYAKEIIKQKRSRNLGTFSKYVKWNDGYFLAITFSAAATI
jgi:hypothetical protein